MFKNFVLAFIPVFVAVDAIGVLPMFISLTNGVEGRDLKKILFQSFVTGITLALGFILIGKWLFSVLGITVYDFMIAGGIILFCIALRDIFFQTEQTASRFGNGHGAYRDAPDSRARGAHHLPYNSRSVRHNPHDNFRGA